MPRSDDEVGCHRRRCARMAWCPPIPCQRRRRRRTSRSLRRCGPRSATRCSPPPLRLDRSSGQVTATPSTAPQWRRCVVRSPVRRPTSASCPARARRTARPCCTPASRSARAHGPALDLAVDPVDGTRLAAAGRPGAMAILAVAPRGAFVDLGPAHYLDKLVHGGADAGLELRRTRRREPRPARRGTGRARRRRCASPCSPGRGTPTSPPRPCVRARDCTRSSTATSSASCMPRHPVARSTSLLGIGGAPEGVLEAAIVRAHGGRDAGVVRAAVAPGGGARGRRGTRSGRVFGLRRALRRRQRSS